MSRLFYENSVQNFWIYADVKLRPNKKNEENDCLMRSHFVVTYSVHNIVLITSLLR